MNTETVEKPINDVRIGDVIEAADGFDLFYMRVERIESLQRGTIADVIFHGVGVGGDGEGELGEIYADPSDTVEVVA